MSLTVHEMGLSAPNFLAVADGSKVIELRLFDAKRQLIRIGDVIEFKNALDARSVVRVRVVALLRYATFGELIEDVPATWFGMPKVEVLKAVYGFYSREDEAYYGVLGIRIELVG